MVDPIQIGVLVDSAANHRLSALAAAAGASRSLFVQRLIENVPLDGRGVSPPTRGDPADDRVTP